MQEIYKTIGRVAGSDATVLMQGESGTGKELIARAHPLRTRRAERSVRRHQLLGDSRATLLESELFGHERGAFTGSDRTQRSGKFEVADGGTLFLDEIADLAARAAGEAAARAAGARVHAHRRSRSDRGPTRASSSPTNHELADLVRKGKRFREDLYFRLNVVPIVVPPLRTRRGDIPELRPLLHRKINREMKVQITGLGPDAESLLVEHSWPGNVRELENALMRACVMAGGRTLTSRDSPLSTEAAAPPVSTADGALDEVVRRQACANYFQQHGDVLRRISTRSPCRGSSVRFSSSSSIAPRQPAPCRANPRHQPQHPAKKDHGARRPPAEMSVGLLSRLYAIVDVEAGGEEVVRRTEGLLRGGARLLQLRWKRTGVAAFLAAAAECGRLAQVYGARLMINDRVDVALACGADGVHLGQSDLPLAAARRLLGAHRWIGVSTHDVEQARVAAAGGADYVGFGPIFADVDETHGLFAARPRRAATGASRRDATDRRHRRHRLRQRCGGHRSWRRCGGDGLCARSFAGRGRRRADRPRALGRPPSPLTQLVPYHS